MVPRKGLSVGPHNNSTINDLVLSEIDPLYQVNVPKSIAKLRGLSPHEDLTMRSVARGEATAESDDVATRSLMPGEAPQPPQKLAYRFERRGDANRPVYASHATRWLLFK